MSCDRDICATNEYNGIGCDECVCAPQEVDRDCDNCVHHVTRDGKTGCEVWECDYEGVSEE